MGAPRQIRFLLLATITFAVVGGLALMESRRTAALGRIQRDSETRELEDRFGREYSALEKRLADMKLAALRALTSADRGNLPLGVVSVSMWTKSANGFQQTSGFGANGVWEQALYRVLPAEIAKHTRQAILPLSGPELANDAASETLRLGIFPESDGARFTAIAFRPDQVFGGWVGSEGMRRVLIEDSGLVLAHTRASEVGQRTSTLADLYRRKESASHQPGMVYSLASKSWEGFPTTIRFIRLPGWSAYFVMERVHSPVRAVLNPWFLILGLFGVLVGFLFVALAFFPVKAKRAAPIEPIVTAPVQPPLPRQGLRELRANPPPFVPRAPAISFSPPPAPQPTPQIEVTSELGRFIAAREARAETHEQNRLRREKILLEEFETDARRARNLERLEAKLVESASGATQSPALFFRYDPLQGIARLSAEAGYPSTQSIIDAGGMSFALETSLVAEIHAEIGRGRPQNLWEYAPLARAMLSRLGIANFEAWAMVSARSANGGPSRLLGVLVVAESGVDSVLHRGFLGSLLERASRHYARQNA